MRPAPAGRTAREDDEDSQLARPTRERILAVAARLLLAEGFARVSMDDVANAASITKRTLYRYFPSKEILVAAVVDDHMTRGEAAFEARLEADEPLAIRMERLASFLAEQARSVSPRFILDLQSAYPEQHQRVLEFRRQRLHGLVSTLQQAQDRGEVRTDIVVPVAVEALLVAIEHVSSPDRLRRSEASYPDAMRTVLEVFLHGMLVPTGWPPKGEGADE